MENRDINTISADAAHHSRNFSYPALTAVTDALRIAIEQKGLDVCGLELKGCSDVADYFVIVSATSDRHAQGIAEKIRLHLKLHGEEPISVTGFETAEWILLDYGDFVVHIFYEPTRQYYAFDELWKKAKVLALEPELEQQARRLRTGMIRCQAVLPRGEAELPHSHPNAN